MSSKGREAKQRQNAVQQQKVAYMGHVITSDRLQAVLDKIKAILNMPVPTDKEGVQMLLLMTNYVQRFASGQADASKQLRDLLKK